MTKDHPIFDGLSCGGMMDYTFYREIIPDTAWHGQDPPSEAVAGAIKIGLSYWDKPGEAHLSGLFVSAHEFNAGGFILNTLRIAELLMYVNQS